VSRRAPPPRRRPHVRADRVGQQAHRLEAGPLVRVRPDARASRSAPSSVRRTNRHRHRSPSLSIRMCTCMSTSPRLGYPAPPPANRPQWLAVVSARGSPGSGADRHVYRPGCRQWRRYLGRSVPCSGSVPGGPRWAGGRCSRPGAWSQPAINVGPAVRADGRRAMAVVGHMAMAIAKARVRAHLPVVLAARSLAASGTTPAGRHQPTARAPTDPMP
jgi:hypothetical protein